MHVCGCACGCRFVVVLTDGCVGNTDDVLRLVHDDHHHSLHAKVKHTAHVIILPDSPTCLCILLS